jgi:hypothetical protein
LISALNGTIKDVCPYLSAPHELSEAHTLQFKKVHWEYYDLLMKHQANANNRAFSRFLTARSKVCGYEDHYDTFLTLQPNQSHLYGDLFPTEESPSTEMNPPIVEVPPHLAIPHGLTIQPIRPTTERRPHHYFNQYIPIYAFRPDYVQSLLFVFID